MKFLHIADVHLGCTRYQLAESPRDFFDAWIDVLRRYAIGEQVDFVIMCGDFFHKRSVPPETMNYAVEGLVSRRADDRYHTLLPIHHLCLFRLGVPLGELWYLHELAGWLREHQRSRFLLTAPPLRLPGAVGCPATPIATV